MAEKPQHPTDERGAPALPETATPASKPATGTDTVTVVCRYPAGIILQAFAKTTQNEPVMGGGSREVIVHERVGEPFVVKGPVVNTGAYRQAGEFPEGIVGGAMLNPGVPRDLWENWLYHNRESHLVVNRLVFAAESYDRAAAMAREDRDRKSGLEPLDPDNPSRRNPGEYAGIERGMYAPGARKVA